MSVGWRSVPCKCGKGGKKHAARRGLVKLTADLPGSSSAFCFLLAPVPAAVATRRVAGLCEVYSSSFVAGYSRVN
jgi:hypothetical protein